MKAERRSRRSAGALLLVLPFLLAADVPGHRFHRTIEGAAGWTELEIPDDVLDAACPGLPDLRVLSTAGEEIPYAMGGALATPPVKVPLIDFEQTDKETTALADRGTSRPLSDTVELEVTEREFIKPITLEASPDRAAWRQIARGSIFATASGARMMRLHFAPNDRRYWRFRFDDRYGPPIKVSHILVGASPEREAPPRLAQLELKAESESNLSASTYTTVLPSANLRLSALRVRATDAAFVRRVRVFERVWFRDEVSRRLLGEGDISRSGAGEDQLSLPLSEPAGKHLEIEIDRSGGVPLHGVTAEAVIETQALRFHAPQGAAPELVYGASTNAAPEYDVRAALRGGAPATFSKAKLGPVSDTGAQASVLPTVTRGVPIDTTGWKTEQPIALPVRGPIAYLDLDRGAGPLYDVRIIDQNRQQVPYIVETEPRHARLPLAFRVEHAPGATLVHLDGLEREKAPIEIIELEITAPEYFERDVQVIEQLFDARGKADRRSLGSAHFVKAGDRAVTPFRIAVTEASSSQLMVQITEGDNAPIVVGGVSAETSRRRLNFVFTDGDDLRLLSNNGAASAPKYDLALVAAKVLSSPAEPATLVQARSLAVAPKSTPGWFWIFVLAAALILIVALGRTLTQTPGQSS